jgi:hypothetical protein
MKVFISWSGDKSRDVALALRDWLPGVINSIEPFVSAKDIYAGTRWQAEIASQLDSTNFGIVCVTKDNQLSSWLNFEAGALAKAVDSSRLVLRRRSEQAERGGADSQGVGRRRRTERQRGGECLCLRLGQRRRELGDRTGEREQAGVRQLALRLDAGCTQDAHAARTPHCFLEQGGLPDARLAHKDERAAASALDRGE